MIEQTSAESLRLPLGAVVALGRGVILDHEGRPLYTFENDTVFEAREPDFDFMEYLGGPGVIGITQYEIEDIESYPFLAFRRKVYEEFLFCKALRFFIQTIYPGNSWDSRRGFASRLKIHLKHDGVYQRMLKVDTLPLNSVINFSLFEKGTRGYALYVRAALISVPTDRKTQC